MWKRDLKFAVRNWPLDQSQAWCFWSAWKVEEEIWLSRHLAAPFGCVSSCFAFHRLGAFFSAVTIRSFNVPTGRHVDDFYGVGRADVQWIGGHCLDLLVMLVGVDIDETKSEDDKMAMVAFGHLVQVDGDQRVAKLCVEQEEADTWSESLLKNLEGDFVIRLWQASLLEGSVGCLRLRLTKSVGRTFDHCMQQLWHQFHIVGFGYGCGSFASGGWSSCGLAFWQSSEGGQWRCTM